MSEHLRPASLVAALAFAPVMAMAGTSGCQPLPLDFVLCAQGTDWETAEREDLSDGVLFTSARQWLEVFDMSELFPAGIPLDAILDQMEAEFAQEAKSHDVEAPLTLSRDRFSTDHLEIVSLTNRVALEPGEVESFVTMIAEAGGRRISISIDPGEDVDPELLFAATRAVAELIRPASGG